MSQHANVPVQQIRACVQLHHRRADLSRGQGRVEGFAIVTIIVRARLDIVVRYNSFGSSGLFCGMGWASCGRDVHIWFTYSHNSVANVQVCDDMRSCTYSINRLHASGSCLWRHWQIRQRHFRWARVINTSINLVLCMYCDISQSQLPPWHTYTGIFCSHLVCGATQNLASSPPSTPLDTPCTLWRRPMLLLVTSTPQPSWLCLFTACRRYPLAWYHCLSY